MQHEQYGQLLLDAIRETLETMAFAEVIPYSMKIGDRELVDPEELRATVRYATPPAELDDAWGTSSESAEAAEAWGANPSPITDRMWANPLDAWEENGDLAIPEISEADKTEQADFEKLMNAQNDWCWACLKVNSPELDAIWFIVSKQLAQELARTMYAGDDFQLDNPALRDIIAELTNVLGGRLMLLLEEIIGKFTLEVPVTGTGQPELPDNAKFETVTCKVFVDGVYPVISVMSFKDKEQQAQPVKVLHAEVE